MSTPLVLRKLRVGGSRVDVSLDDVYVGEQLNVHVVHGDVAITNLNSSSSADLQVRTGDGSVLVTTSRDVRAAFAQPQGGIPEYTSLSK